MEVMKLRISEDRKKSSGISIQFLSVPLSAPPTFRFSSSFSGKLMEEPAEKDESPA